MALVPSGYLPFTCTELNKTLVDYARENLNETEETKRKGLEAVREFLKEKLNIHYEVPDNLILCFLRSRKFNIKRTCTLIRNLANFVETHKGIFIREKPGVVQKVFESNVMGFLPYRDSEGRAIVYIRAECWDPDDLIFEEVLFGNIVNFHIATMNPVSQVAGFIVILDCKNLTFQHILGVSSRLIFTVQALLNSCPCLVKVIHVLHAPTVFQAAWKVVYPLLSEKIRKRILIYKKSSSLEELHRNVPSFLLPEELGGQLGPYTHAHWACDVLSVERKFYKLLETFFNRHKKDLQD